MQKIPTGLLNKEYISHLEKRYGENYMETDLEYYLVNIRVYFVDDVTYEKYLKENSLASNTNRNSNVRMPLWLIL